MFSQKESDPLIDPEMQSLGRRRPHQHIIDPT